MQIQDLPSEDTTVVVPSVAAMTFLPHKPIQFSNSIHTKPYIFADDLVHIGDSVEVHYHFCDCSHSVTGQVCVTPSTYLLYHQACLLNHIWVDCFSRYLDHSVQHIKYIYCKKRRPLRLHLLGTISYTIHRSLALNSTNLWRFCVR